MNKTVFAALAVASSLACSSAFAAATTVPQTFNVKATLNAQCKSVTVGVPNVDFGVYTAFVGPATAAPTASIKFECSNGLPLIGAALDATTGSLVGVTYNLALGADTVSASGAGAAGGTTHTYVVTGSMVGGQAGDTAGPTSVLRTLTISY